MLHPAITALGDQPSVVIATAGGSIVKCNSDAWTSSATTTPAAGAAPAPAADGGTVAIPLPGVVYGVCEATVEPSRRGGACLEAARKPPAPPSKRRGGVEGQERAGGVVGIVNPVRREFFEKHR
ncbi:unnamed protein product [Sphacelaria rigidula]